MLEGRLSEVIYEAKKVGVSVEEFLEIAETLYGDG